MAHVLVLESTARDLVGGGVFREERDAVGVSVRDRGCEPRDGVSVGQVRVGLCGAGDYRECLSGGGVWVDEGGESEGKGVGNVDIPGSFFGVCVCVRERIGGTYVRVFS